MATRSARGAGAGHRNRWSTTLSNLWQRSYAADYLGLGLLVAAYVLIQVFAEPFHRMFSLDNLAIQYPHAITERVPLFWLMVYAAAVPLVVIILWAITARPGVHTVHVTLLGLFISFLLTSFITDVIKNAVGRPRPDLIARCKPALGTPEHALVTFEICTETDLHVLHDGWRSFPSGHSSSAFSGLGYLSLLLCGQMHVFRPRTDLARVLISLAPLLGAALIAISRLADYRHDVYDVTVGSFLGMLVAFFSYRRYFPPLQSSKCHIPFPNRADIQGDDYTKIKEDEERIRDANAFTLDDMPDEGEGVPLRDLERDQDRDLERGRP